MRRNEFFTTLGVSAGSLIFAPYLISCSKDDSVNTGPGSGGSTGGAVDFTLDLTLAGNSSLNTNGGSLVKSGVIVARTSNGTFVAVASACSHEGFALAFDNPNNQFHCANHGSNFATNGSVLNGPATISLKKYNAILTGTSLRVYA